jgi:heat shock protein HtpX
MALLNQAKTVFLLGLLTGVLLGIGYLIGGNNGLLIGLVLALVLNFLSYWFSDKIVLKMYRAKEAKKNEYPRLHKIVEEVSKSAKIPKPRVYIVPNSQANAFATGRNPKHAVIACTTGIMGLLNDAELKGVIAHEMSHIKNRDILISTIAAVIAGAISYIAFMARFAAIFGGMGRDRNSGNFIGLLVLAILTPIIAMIIRMAISRSREYLADETGAKLIKNGEPLASALMKLEQCAKVRPMRMGSEGSAHMFIVNPFSAKSMFKLFSTHPTVPDRCRRLRSMRF